MILVLNIINYIFNILSLNKFLHLYQLKDYNTRRYLAFFKNKKVLLIFTNIFILVLLIIINNNILTFILNLFSIILFNTFNFKLIKSNKTPIKYTGKIIRLYLISSILLIFPIFLINGVIISNLLLIILPNLSNLLNFYDYFRNKLFIKSARKKLKTFKTKIIAITGSNGKTSVKNILLELLKSYYPTQATPRSFNTPLGISKFINNELSPDTKYLILEYGARHKGDIRKLCRLFGADFGIVTTISPQHLQTFLSIENIYLTKKELPDYLKDRTCIYNLDNIYTYRMYQEKDQEKYGISLYFNSNLTAQNIRIENFTTSFTLIINNKSYSLKTKLLGKHNITNILLATALALKLDIPIDNIKHSIEHLQPTSHRLEYLRGAINILDDSYNCSLSSAKEALAVLQESNAKKMILTPGIIEGGRYQNDINFKLGTMCQFADYLVIIGETNKKALTDGFTHNQSKMFPLYAKDLDSAKQYFSLLSSNDTLLLLNDLPDDFK